MNIKNFGCALILSTSNALGQALARGTPAPPTKVTSTVKAMAIAKKELERGKTFDATREFAGGHWVHGVMVVKNHKISEVEIDSVNGKIGDLESVDPNGEAEETLASLSKMIKSGG